MENIKSQVVGEAVNDQAFDVDESVVENAAADALEQKLADAAIPGFAAEFDPEEAEQAGAFSEDALSETDAADSSVDLGEQP